MDGNLEMIFISIFEVHLYLCYGILITKKFKDENFMDI